MKKIFAVLLAGLVLSVSLATTVRATGGESKYPDPKEPYCSEYKAVVDNDIKFELGKFIKVSYRWHIVSQTETEVVYQLQFDIDPRGGFESWVNVQGETRTFEIPDCSPEDIIVCLDGEKELTIPDTENAWNRVLYSYPEAVKGECPAPEPEPEPEPQSEPRGFSMPGAPVCPNGVPAIVPANPHVVRNGSEAVVNAHIPEGNVAHIYFKENSADGWQHAERDIPVFGKYLSHTIRDLNPNLGYTFGVQAANGCAGGETVLAVVIDPPAQGEVFMLSYYEWLK